MRRLSWDPASEEEFQREGDPAAPWASLGVATRYTERMYREQAFDAAPHTLDRLANLSPRELLAIGPEVA